MKLNTPPPKKTSSNATLLKIHPTAEFAIDFFANRRLLNKRLLQNVLKELQEHGSKANQIQKWVELKNLFLIPVGTNLVLMVSVQGRTVTVLDVLTREKFDLLQNGI